MTEVAEWAAEHPDAPVTMLNLLRFRDAARDGLGCDGMTGAEAYRKYGSGLMSMEPPFSGQPIWYGTANVSVIAPDDEKWDEVALVRYANAAEFMSATSRPDYEEIAQARTAALADSRLVLMLELLHDKS